jgi:hypothetical protein
MLIKLLLHLIMFTFSCIISLILFLIDEGVINNLKTKRKLIKKNNGDIFFLLPRMNFFAPL